MMERSHKEQSLTMGQLEVQHLKNDRCRFQNIDYAEYHYQQGISHYKGAAKLGHGIGYKYAHDYPNHYVDQQYLPDEIKDAKFYDPSDNGHEKEIKEWMEYIRR